MINKKKVLELKVALELIKIHYLLNQKIPRYLIKSVLDNIELSPSVTIDHREVDKDDVKIVTMNSLFSEAQVIAGQSRAKFQEYFVFLRDWEVDQIFLLMWGILKNLHGKNSEDVQAFSDSSEMLDYFSENDKASYQKDLEALHKKILANDEASEEDPKKLKDEYRMILKDKTVAFKSRLLAATKEAFEERNYDFTEPDIREVAGLIAIHKRYINESDFLDTNKHKSDFREFLRHQFKQASAI